MDKHKCRNFTARATRTRRISMGNRRRGIVVYGTAHEDDGGGDESRRGRNEAHPRVNKEARGKMEGKVWKKSRQKEG
jgi:hypothetical protein